MSSLAATPNPDKPSKSASTLELPKGSVKRIMKINQEVPNVSAEAIVAVAKAAEEFVGVLARTSREVAITNNRKTIKVEDIIAATQSQGTKMEFLEDAFGPTKGKFLMTRRIILNYHSAGRLYSIVTLIRLLNRSYSFEAGNTDMNIFGTRQEPVDPSKLAKEWKRKLQKEGREIDRGISNLKREEAKALAECKKLAKSGHLPASRILARQIVDTRKATERMYMAKAHMNSVALQLQESASVVKLKDNVKKSSEIMATMNGLMNIQEVSKTMRELAVEMERAGFIEGIVDDAMASLEPENLQSEADLEVDRILTEITSDIFAKASEAPSVKIAHASPATTTVPVADVVDNDTGAEELREMQARLQSL